MEEATSKAVLIFGQWFTIAHSHSEIGIPSLESESNVRLPPSLRLRQRRRNGGIDALFSPVRLGIRMAVDENEVLHGIAVLVGKMMINHDTPMELGIAISRQAQPISFRSGEILVME